MTFLSIISSLIIILNLTFAIFEFLGGIFTNSVAIISDSLHDLGDSFSIGISYALEKKSKKEPDNKYTFGYREWPDIFEDEDMKDVEFELCGVCTDICVVSNALLAKAYCPDTQISVKADCCAGTSVAKHNAALAVMSSCQINII